MKLNKILKKIDLVVGEEEMSDIRNSCNFIIQRLEGEVKKQRISADVFIGGSYAKGTMVKSEKYDIDVFVRFNPEVEEISKKLERLIENISNDLELKINKVHGSRDYFQLEFNERIIFEFIPVLKIKDPTEAKNVTDLSFFHVKYVRKALSKNQKNEVVIAKQFCKAQRVYGAESYIHGFSGYALECLIAQYKSFEKMLKEIILAKDKILLDPAKKYKRKQDIKLFMNESRLQSPIVLVDPTWDERNVLAALSDETLERFKDAAERFLKNPSEEFFQLRELNIEGLRREAKRKKAEYIEIYLETDKREGDIAGTKMKKFAKFLENQLAQSFTVIQSEFQYKGGKNSRAYYLVKSKREIKKSGPPTHMKKYVEAFKKIHKDTFIKNGIVHANIAAEVDPRKFIERFKRDHSKQISEMDISLMRIA